MTAPDGSEHSRFQTVTQEEFEQADLEAPIRASRNVDCWSLAGLYETASKEQAESGNDPAARVYGHLAQVTDMHFEPDDVAEPFSPSIAFPDGRRSMMPGDLKGEQSVVFARSSPTSAAARRRRGCPWPPARAPSA